MTSIAREVFDSLTWELLQRWVKEHEPETLHLEFKRKEEPKTATIDPEDKANIGKALSAFANVEGGLYVIGVDAGGGQRSGKTFDRARRLVPLVEVDAFGGDLDRRLRTFTDPPIAGLQCKSLSPSSGSPGVVAVYVPQSDGGPHRVTNATSDVNDRYYMRTAGGDQTMPHSLLADRFGRTARPSLRAHFQIAPVRTEKSQSNLSVILTLHNIGRGAAIRPALLLRKRPTNRLVMWPLTEPEMRFRGRATRDLEILYEPDEPSESVLYPGMFEVVARGRLTQFENRVDYRFAVTLFALDAQPVEAEGALRGEIDLDDPVVDRPSLLLPTREP